jgi:chromate transporter
VRSTLGADWLLWALSSISAIVTAWTESELLWLFLLAGVIAIFARGVAPKGIAAATAVLPVWWITGLHGPAVSGTLGKIFWYFAEAGAFVFGSGLAIVPFLHGGVVNQFGWLTERQFLDAVAVAMITPGPVVITVAFIGYLVAGPAGASVAALAVFLPCYLFVILPAPYFRKYANNPTIKAFVDGVTAAAIGAIAGAAFVLGKWAIIDLVTLLLGIAAYTVLWKARRIPEPLIILAAGLIGFVLAQNR